MQDALLNFGASTTATTAGTTGASSLYFPGGGPINGLRIKALIRTASVATAGTAAQTYTPHVLVSANSASLFRIVASGPTITATTSAITARVYDLLAKIPKDEPYVKVAMAASAATGATTPVCVHTFDVETGQTNNTQ